MDRLRKLLFVLAVASSIFAPPSAVRIEDAVVFLLAVATFWRPSRMDRQFQDAAVAIGLCSVWLLLVGYTAMSINDPPPTFSRSSGAVFEEVGRLVKHGVVAFAFLRVAGGADKSRVLGRGMCLVLVAHAAVGLAQYFRVRPVVELIEQSYASTTQLYNVSERALDVGRFRATGMVFNPNIYGAVAVFLAIGCFVTGSSRTRAIAALALVTAVMLSASRTASGIAFVVLAGIFIYEKSALLRGGLLIGGAISGALVVARGLEDLSPSQARIFSPGATDFLGSRYQYADLGALVLDRSPIEGFGIGTRWFIAADSDYLIALTQGGLLALFGLALLYLRLGGLLVPRHYGSILMLSMIGVGATNGMYYGNEVAPLAFAALALVLAQPAATTVEGPAPEAVEHRAIPLPRGTLRQRAPGAV
jgi:hypothetical protein